MRGLLLTLCAVFAAIGAHAIEAPKQSIETPPAERTPAAEIAPSDETQFYEQLQRVTHWRNLRG